MSFLRTVIACIAIIAAYKIYIRRIQRAAEDEAPAFDALELSGEVQQLAATMQDLETADRMRLDLQTCKQGTLHRSFRTVWQGSDGRNRELAFLADGQSAASAALLDAATDERDRLNQEIIDRIRILAAMIDGTAAATVCSNSPEDTGGAEMCGRSDIYGDKYGAEIGRAGKWTA